MTADTGKKVTIGFPTPDRLLIDRRENLCRIFPFETLIEPLTEHTLAILFKELKDGFRKQLLESASQIASHWTNGWRGDRRWQDVGLAIGQNRLNVLLRIAAVRVYYLFP